MRIHFCVEEYVYQEGDDEFFKSLSQYRLFTDNFKVELQRKYDLRPRPSSINLSAKPPIIKLTAKNIFAYLFYS